MHQVLGVVVARRARSFAHRRWGCGVYGRRGGLLTTLWRIVFGNKSGCRHHLDVEATFTGRCSSRGCNNAGIFAAGMVCRGRGVCGEFSGATLLGGGCKRRHVCIGPETGGVDAIA